MRQAMNSRCRRFDMLLFRCWAQSVAVMTTVIAVQTDTIGRFNSDDKDITVAVHTKANT